MTPLQTLFVLILSVVVLSAPRRYALLALFIAVFFLSQRGGLQLGGLRLHAGRILELAGIARVVFRKEVTKQLFGSLDRAVLVTYGFVTLMFILRAVTGPPQPSDVTMSTPSSKIGDFVDVALIYVVFRALVHDLDDVRWLLKRCVVLLIPLVISLAIEHVTYSNPLSVIGAMKYVWIDDASDGGRVRCYGASAHPALLGTVGAWFVVLYVALILSKEDRKVGLLGAGLSMAVVLLGNSGGPLSALMAGFAGWACWFIRERMRLVRYGVLAGFVLLAIVMKAPLWYLPSKMSVVFGGSGWHRSYLMDQFITHFSQWWLAGMPLADTASWFPYLVMGAADITNLFVAFGIDGGLGAMVLLVWLIVTAFRRVGVGMRALDAEQPANRNDQLLMWAMGCGVMTHLVNYFAITYFDQTNFVWFFQLAAVSAASAALAARAKGTPEVGRAGNRPRVPARAVARNPRQRRPAAPSH